jgi:hypothetical protein
MCSVTPIIRINLDSKTSGDAENPDNWILFENRLLWQFKVKKIYTNGYF